MNVDPALVIQPGDKVLERVQLDGRTNEELRDRCEIEGFELFDEDSTLYPPRRWHRAWVETAEGRRASRFATDDGDLREMAPRRGLQRRLSQALIDAMPFLGTLDSKISVGAARTIAEGELTEKTIDGDMGRYWVPVADWLALERGIGAFDLTGLSLNREIVVRGFGAGEQGRRWRFWWSFTLRVDGREICGHLRPTWDEGPEDERRAWKEGEGCASGGVAQIQIKVAERYLQIAPPANVPPTAPKVDAP